MAEGSVKHMSRNDRLYNKIKAEFAENANVRQLLIYLDLPRALEEEVDSVESTKGRFHAASLLLRNFVCQPDWFDRLIRGLRQSGSGFLAADFEKLREELLVVIDVPSVTVTDGDGDVEMLDISDSTHTPMEVDPSTSPTAEEVQALRVKCQNNDISQEIYNENKLRVFKDGFTRLLMGLVETPEEMVSTFALLQQLCSVLFAGASYGSLELFVTIRDVHTLMVLKKLYYGGALCDSLREGIQKSEAMKKLQASLAQYGFTVHGIRLKVTIKEEEFDECERLLKRKTGLSLPEDFMEACLFPVYPLKEGSMAALKKFHEYPPGFKKFCKAVAEVTNESSPMLMNTPSLYTLTKSFIKTLQSSFDKDVTDDMTKVGLKMLADQEKDFVEIELEDRESKLKFEQEVLMAHPQSFLVPKDLKQRVRSSKGQILSIDPKFMQFQSSQYSSVALDPQKLVASGILVQIIGKNNAFKFSKPIFRDFAIFFLNYNHLEKQVQDVVFQDKKFEFGYIFWVFKLVSCHHQISLPMLQGPGTKQMELLYFLSSEKKCTKLGSCLFKGGVMDFSKLKQDYSYKYLRQILHGFELSRMKVCEPEGVAAAVFEVIKEHVLVFPRSLVSLCGKLAGLTTRQFEIIMRVLHLLDLDPVLEADKGQLYLSIVEKKKSREGSSGLLGLDYDSTVSFHLDISCSKISEGKVRILCQVLPELKHVTRYDFSNTKLDRSRLQKLLASMDANSVKGITLTGLDLGLSKGDVGLSRLKGIEYLDLESTKVDDDGVMTLNEVLESLDNLKELNIGSNGITFEGLVLLSTTLVKNCNLVVLRIHDNKIHDIGAILLGVIVQKLTKLEILSASGCKLEDVGVLQLSKYIALKPGLKRVSLHNNEVQGTYTVEIFQNLARCHDMQFFDYDKNTLIPDDSEDIRTVSDAVLQMMRLSSCWDHLSFWDSQMGRLSIFDDPKKLECLSRLTHLCLQKNEIDNDVAEKLGLCLQANTKYLKHLNLGENLIGDRGALALADCLKEVKFLEELLLDRNLLGYAGTQMVIKVSCDLPHLMICDVSFSFQLSSDEWDILFKSLSEMAQMIKVEDIHVAKVGNLQIKI